MGEMELLDMLKYGFIIEQVRRWNKFVGGTSSLVEQVRRWNKFVGGTSSSVRRENM